MVTPGPGRLDYVEGDGAVALDAALEVTDEDDTTLTGARVRIDAGYLPGEDVLAFGGWPQIEGTWDAASGTLTLSGTASVEDYEAALRTVTYENASQAPGTGPRTVTFEVRDATGWSAPASRAIALADVNDPPVAEDASAAGQEDAGPIEVALSAADGDGTVVSFRVTTSPAHGALYADAALTQAVDAGTEIAATGRALTLYFLPAPDWNGTTGFAYVALDDRGAASAPPAIATIAIAPVGDRPVLTAPSAAWTLEDTALALAAASDLGLSVSTVDGPNAPLRLALSVDRGSLTLASVAGLAFEAGDGTDDASIRATGSAADLAAALASLVYRPAADDHGAVTLTLAAAPLADGAQAARAAVAITVRPVNDAPTLTVAQTDSRAVFAGGRVALGPAAIAAADVDGSPDAIVYTVEAPPASGRLARAGVALAAGDTFTQADVDAGRIAFVAPGVGGVQTVVLSVADTDGASAGARVTMKFTVEPPAVAAARGAGAASPASAVAGGASAAAPPAASDDRGTVAPAAGDGAASEAARLAVPAVAGGARAVSGVAAGAAAQAGASAGAGPSAQAGVESWVAPRLESGSGASPQDASRFAASGEAGGGWSDAAAGAGTLDAARADTAGAADGWRLAMDGGPEARSISARVWSPLLALQGSDFGRELEQAREQSISRFEIKDAIVASSLAVTTSLSIGYAIWVLRGGVLLTSLLASMPAWRSIDPLPVLARIDARGRDDEHEDDSLRGMLRRAAQRESDAAAPIPGDPAEPRAGAGRATAPNAPNAPEPA